MKTLTIIAIALVAAGVGVAVGTMIASGYTREFDPPSVLIAENQHLSSEVARLTAVLEDRAQQEQPEESTESQSEAALPPAPERYTDPQAQLEDAAEELAQDANLGPLADALEEGDMEGASEAESGKPIAGVRLAPLLAAPPPIRGKHRETGLSLPVSTDHGGAAYFLAACSISLKPSSYCVMTIRFLNSVIDPLPFGTHQSSPIESFMIFTIATLLLTVRVDHAHLSTPNLKFEILKRDRFQLRVRVPL